jgi:hypothetical protein
MMRIRRFLLNLLAEPLGWFGLSVFKVNALRIGTGRFCDYCPCEDCRVGTRNLQSLACEDGSHICGVCYGTEPCGDYMGFGRKRGSFFCRSHPKCEHKPKLLPAARVEA